MSNCNYKGWRIWLGNDNLYHAIQWGVTMNTNTYNGIKQMIDNHITDKVTYALSKM